MTLRSTFAVVSGSGLLVLLVGMGPALAQDERPRVERIEPQEPSLERPGRGPGRAEPGMERLRNELNELRDNGQKNARKQADPRQVGRAPTRKPENVVSESSKSFENSVAANLGSSPVRSR